MKTTSMRGRGADLLASTMSFASQDLGRDFRIGRQQDAGEGFLALLERLAEKDRKRWERTAGEMVAYTSCDYSRLKVECKVTRWDLTVVQSTSLRALLHANRSSEPLDAGVQCERCKRKRGTTRTTVSLDLPEIAMLNFKRGAVVNAENPAGVMTRHKIELPSRLTAEDLILRDRRQRKATTIHTIPGQEKVVREFVAPEVAPDYDFELWAIVQHIGDTVKVGHYTASTNVSKLIGEQSRNPVWMKFDDTQFSRLPGPPTGSTADLLVIYLKTPLSRASASLPSQPGATKSESSSAPTSSKKNAPIVANSSALPSWVWAKRAGAPTEPKLKDSVEDFKEPSSRGSTGSSADPPGPPRVGLPSKS